MTDGAFAPSVIDILTLECQSIRAACGPGVTDVAAMLRRLDAHHGPPQRLFCDNGSEFTGRLADLCAYANIVVESRSIPSPEIAIVVVLHLVNSVETNISAREAGDMLAILVTEPPVEGMPRLWPTIVEQPFFSAAPSSQNTCPERLLCLYTLLAKD
jgi:hypothetical protein